MKGTSKKIKINLLALSIFTIICVVGLTAYFTSINSVINHIKMGKVDIELNEYVIIDGKKISLENVDIVTPGEVLNKIPVVKCKEDSEDCYIRVKFDWFTKDGKILVDGENINVFKSFNIDKDKWIYCKSDGYVYYKEPLKSDSEGITIYTELTIPENLTNDMKLKEIYLGTKVDAIQARNFQPDFSLNSTEPWPGITENDIQKSIKSSSDM